MTRVALVTMLAAVVLGSAACAQESNPPGSDVVETTDTTIASAPGTSAVDDEIVRADVKITQCVAGAYTPTVGLEVVNSALAAQGYAVTVRIKDATGKDAGEAVFAKNRMDPGERVTEDIPGDTPVQGKITCAVATAKRLPPK
ncbi:hypothetical protein [Amycolatopsis sp. H20-H5]|uniref:hypothetical protein n=1 Tax=Amycolatopsis sp. H20-H5 TaxID=3046309 RepID=UPI002DBBC909|nr:hypothetical protein [Amycolatopsis sp. H20-H5]MEC3980983.1 hypothetical protein [Amycolatopsis sp. H20-H5]